MPTSRETALAVGVTEEKMSDDPVYGLLISASGIHKMAARAPDTKGKMMVLQAIQGGSPFPPTAATDD